MKSLPRLHFTRALVLIARYNGHGILTSPEAYDPKNQSQIVLLPACPRILIHMPFGIATLTFERSTSNLEQPHCHPRPYLCQFYALIACPNKYMMSNFNTVFNVLESYNSVANFLVCRRCFSRGKEML